MSYTFANFSRPLLTKKQLEWVEQYIDSSQDTSFTLEYQEQKVTKENPSYYSLATLLEACDRSSKVFAQYELDERKIKNLAKSIFVDDNWLQRDPVVAFVGEDLYVVGGRHRLTTIASVLASLTHLQTNRDTDAATELFNTYLAQEVRVDVLYVKTMENLLALVSSDNQARVMRKAEKSHLKAQLLGADDRSSLSALHTAVTSEISPRLMKEVAAQAFTRREHPKLRPQTLQQVGERVAQYILFGVKTSHRGQKVKLLDKDISTFKQEFDKAWELLCNIVQTQTVVARESRAIADRIIDRLAVSQGDAPASIGISKSAETSEKTLGTPEIPKEVKDRADANMETPKQLEFPKVPAKSTGLSKKTTKA